LSQSLPHKPVVFLYSEMAGYLMSCIKELAKTGVLIHVYHWPVNKEAPFVFDEIEGVVFNDRSSYEEQALHQEIQGIDPSCIICSGWMDKGYVKIVGSFKKRIPTIIALDNHWTGKLKQRIMQVSSPLYVRKNFTHAWVAGEPQAVYARKLGFKEDKLLDGFYSADTTFFKAQFQKNQAAKSANFPKTFLYVGRYIPHKGIYDMWEAFLSLKEEKKNDWKLLCVGAGDDYEKRVMHEDITHYGFVQPKELSEIIAKAGVFILPSHFEPWGVVVHEFAAAGMPLLLSEEIGAASAFLKQGENGMLFKAKQANEIKRVMSEMMAKSHEELVEMSRNSHAKAAWIDPKKWTEKLINLL